ncbi:hypothetical protein CH063_02949 [Colletotrichum higginsianum]|uniref:Uncharacterized protein n=1 Tax=Colletotrichum higginsianum (strain IMI 349063) TaxID=759273 RepID=H1VRP7_COLHI|nr:hypothetical protein CH63R_08263 [Colletotrichum higginsianum IMI 349063]OBR09498.1 hypothetical protein CH63R_08263 [Colletotrichum higginsianum IMI 349063]CCF42903.1 hypothetical protein CH063_02949 [Colletotrichum higginsianum]
MSGLATGTVNQSIDYLVTNKVCELLDEIADPDVTGWGVVASFMISFGLTYVAIILAYIFRLLPDSRYNSIDLDASQNLSPLRSDSFPLRLPEWHNTQGSRKETRIKRVRAFESFILAMSDQQLITGVALIIVTTYMTFSELSESFSVYSFQVATRLGYCSCIVHLCTISLLREHFDANKRLRDFRVILVSVFLVLLAVCMVISDSVTFRFNRRISVKCARENLKLVDPERPRYVKYSDELILVSNLVVLILVLLLGYLRRFLELYYPLARHDSNYWTALSLRPIFGQAVDQAYDNADKERRSSLKALLKQRGRGNPAPLHLTQWPLVFKIWFESVSTSFLWDIMWLTFYFVFGVAGLWKFYIYAHAEHAKMKPNFGQLVPLILVGLPFLAAWEAYSSTVTPAQPQSESSSTITPADNYQSNESQEVSSDSGGDEMVNFSDTRARNEGALKVVAKDLHISLKWLKISTWVYALALPVWALMFADVIPGAFYVSLVAGFLYLLVGLASWCSAAWTVISQ